MKTSQIVTVLKDGDKTVRSITLPYSFAESLAEAIKIDTEAGVLSLYNGGRMIAFRSKVKPYLKMVGKDRMSDQEIAKAIAESKPTFGKGRKPKNPVRVLSADLKTLAKMGLPAAAEAQARANLLKHYGLTEALFSKTAIAGASAPASKKGK